MRNKSLFILAMFILAAACLSGACTKKFSVAPKAADLPTQTPTPSITVTSSHSPTATHTVTATFTPTRTATPRAYLITTVAGTGNQGYSGDGGTATSADLNDPNGVAVDSSGNLYIADYSNHVIRKVDAGGIITTVAGIPGMWGGYSGDGGPATLAEMFMPTSVAFDLSGNLYIADFGNNVVRKVDTSGIITTVAGIGGYPGGFSGDGGPATLAELNYPSDVAVDPAGNLYITDSNNNRIRKVDTSGIITTIAGNGNPAYRGDGGPAASAELDWPGGITLDGAGNLYFSDINNSVIRKVSPGGTITTVAGTGSQSYSGDGGPAVSAELYFPFDVTADVLGNLYIADTYNQAVRKVDTGGIITTVAGNNTAGFSGDGGPAIAASMNTPIGLAVDSSGNIYIADSANYRIRKVY